MRCERVLTQRFFTQLWSINTTTIVHNRCPSVFFWTKLLRNLEPIYPDYRILSLTLGPTTHVKNQSTISFQNDKWEKIQLKKRRNTWTKHNVLRRDSIPELRALLLAPITRNEVQRNEELKREVETSRPWFNDTRPTKLLIPVRRTKNNGPKNFNETRKPRGIYRRDFGHQFGSSC